MAFCTNCGSQLNDGARFCPNCGARLENVQAVNQPPHSGQSYQQQSPQSGQAYQQQTPPPAGQFYQRQNAPYRQYIPQENILRKLSSRVKINAIVWLIIACLQYLLGFIYLAGGLASYSGGSLIVMGIFVLIVAVVNTLVSVRDFRYSREVLYRPVGICAKFKPVGGYIGMLIYNIFFGGIIGVVGTIYAFMIRSFVMRNEPQLVHIEQQFLSQSK
ncbi:MAG TPA: zinc ribbon domain-containing protein [Firmicutes bacterium]|nr:zinc ribbon domain-containing protein [Bacillota bacterium]